MKEITVVHRIQLNNVFAVLRICELLKRLVTIYEVFASIKTLQQLD